MTYVTVPNTNLAVDKPIRSTDITQMNDNIEDLNSRTVALADPGGVSTHFAEDHGYPSGLIISGATPGSTKPVTIGTAESSTNVEGPYADPRFILSCGASGTWTEKIAGSSTDEHFLRATGGAAAHGLACVSSLYATNRTNPITVTYRLKLSANPNSAVALFIGFSGNLSAVTARPNNGIYLEDVDTTHWRFTTSRGGSNTVGSVQFTPPTAGTWFEVEIVLRDTPSVAADCYVDGDLKETLSGANLPTDKQLFGHLTWVPAGNNFDIDSFTLATAGIDDAA